MLLQQPLSVVSTVAGGVGKVTGSISWVLLVMASLTNGMNVLGWDISIQYIVRAAVLAGAVIFDVQTRRGAKSFSKSCTEIPLFFYLV